MREIFYKAKRIDNGEWVYWNIFGELCRESGKRTRLVIQIGATTSYYDYIHQMFTMIDKDTICQYTGLTDKKGNKIWENDVIRYKDIHAIGKVAFIEESFVLDDEYDGKQYINGMWDKFEVIGNVFDNKELLEE